MLTVGSYECTKLNLDFALIENSC